MAGATGLEPATSCVTGRRSNQLNYAPANCYRLISLKAAAFGQLGQHEDAQNSLRELLALRPNFASTARQDYAKWFEPEMVEHLIDGLRKAGLEIAGDQSSAPPTPRPGQNCNTPSLGSGRS